MSIEDIIKNIQIMWLESVKSRSGKFVKTSLSIISDLFIEPGQFILEFLQNAEDARMELKAKGGYFSITLSNNEVVIKHNGKPFDKEDIESLCDVGSRKKPKEGYKGYIGIGFKSVFNVSNKVYVHSNNPQLGDIAFKFDENYWYEKADELMREYGLQPSDVPYQVVPILVEPTEPLAKGETLFRIKLFDDPVIIERVRGFLKDLPDHMFIFLEYINKVVIEDRVKNYKKVIEWVTKPLETIDDDINVEKVLLNVNDKAERFLVFRKSEKVPDYVRKDIVTRKAKREDVDVREVIIAFALDEYDNLKPIKEAEFWGVYSFMPLPESSSGLKFLVQADLLVHPGRRSVNYEASWNLWLMERLADLLRRVIKYLSERYTISYLPVFEYRNIGTPFYEKLVKPNIVKVIEEELKDPLIPSIKGQLIPLSKAVVYDEKIRDFIEEGLLTEDDLKHIYGEEDLHLVSPDVKLRLQDRSRKLKSVDLLNEKLIRVRLERDLNEAINFLSKVYKKINVPDDDDKRYIITKAGNIVTAKNAYIGMIPEEVIKLSEQYPEIKEFLQNLNYVHDRLLQTLGLEFLKKLGVKEVSFEEVCNKVLLPKIIGDTPPDKEELLRISAILKKTRIYPEGNIWVVARGGEVKRSSEVYYPYELFKPLEFLEKLGFKFLDIDEYVRYGSKEDWEKFFLLVSMKGKTIYSGDYLHKDYQDIILQISNTLYRSTDKDELIKGTRLLKRLCMTLNVNPQIFKIIIKGITVNVLTDQGVRKSTEAFLHSSYKPEQGWMEWKDFYRVGPFVSDEYIDDGDIDGWRKFFIDYLGVRKEATPEQVEEFAEKYVEYKLQERGYKILARHGEGFDYEVEGDDGSILIEVKGKTKTIHDIDNIALTGAQTEKAYKFRGKYWIAVVTNIPNNPTLYIIKDPVGIGKKEIVISKDDIMGRGEVWN
ncbi:MAG: DUF3883 domain-containing protein [Desulfurococcaceae archaeon]